MLVSLAECTLLNEQRSMQSALTDYLKEEIGGTVQKLLQLHISDNAFISRYSQEMTAKFSTNSQRENGDQYNDVIQAHPESTPTRKVISTEFWD